MYPIFQNKNNIHSYMKVKKQIKNGKYITQVTMCEDSNSYSNCVPEISPVSITKQFGKNIKKYSGILFHTHINSYIHTHMYKYECLYLYK